MGSFSLSPSVLFRSNVKDQSTEHRPQGPELPVSSQGCGGCLGLSDQRDGRTICRTQLGVKEVGNRSESRTQSQS
jgi:hypothetical protein